MTWALSSRPFFSGFRITRHQLGQRPPKGRPEGRSLVGIDKAFAFASLTFRETPSTKWQGPIIFNRKGPESICTLMLPVEMLRKRKGFAQVTHWVSGRAGTNTQCSSPSSALSPALASPWPPFSLPYPKQPPWPFLLKSGRRQVWASKLKIRVNWQFWKYGTTMEIRLTK